MSYVPVPGGLHLTEGAGSFMRVTLSLLRPPRLPGVTPLVTFPLPSILPSWEWWAVLVGVMTVLRGGVVVVVVLLCVFVVGFFDCPFWAMLRRVIFECYRL